MQNILGILVVLGSVFGGFYLSNGPMHILFQPVEFLIILGCAFGAFLIANPPSVIKQVFAMLIPFFKGQTYTEEFYKQAIMLLHDLLLINKRDGAIEIEKHIDSPEESNIFERYPLVIKNEHTLHFIIDNIRLVTSNEFQPHVIQQNIESEIELLHKHAKEPAHALQEVSDALPGLGIVAAVLGIINTMQYLDGSNAEIGHHIGVALVGTFAGLFLAYGFVGPCATKLGHMADEEKDLFQTLQVYIMAFIYKYNSETAAEISRKHIPTHYKPSSQDIETAVKESKLYLKKKS